MEAIKYLSGIELRPTTISTDDASIPGFEIRLRWIDVTRPEVPKTGEPLVVAEESLVSMLDGLREQIRQAQSDQERTPRH